MAQTQSTVDGVGRKLGMSKLDRLSAARPLESLSKIVDDYFRQALKLKNIQPDMEYIRARGITIPERFYRDAPEKLPEGARFVQDYGPGIRVINLGDGIWEVDTPIVEKRLISIDTGNLVEKGKIVRYIGENRKEIGKVHLKFIENIVADAWIRWTAKELENMAKAAESGNAA